MIHRHGISGPFYDNRSSSSGFFLLPSNLHRRSLGPVQGDVDVTARALRDFAGREDVMKTAPEDSITIDTTAETIPFWCTHVMRIMGIMRIMRFTHFVYFCLFLSPMAMPWKSFDVPSNQAIGRLASLQSR